MPDLPDCFPIASARDFLVLYQGRGESLELRWRLAKLSSDRARLGGAYPNAGMVPSVRLRRWLLEDGEGEDCFAPLPVASINQGRLGLVRLRPDAWYQAEIGLGNARGAWLMLARSNRLALASLAGFGQTDAASLAAPGSDGACARHAGLSERGLSVSASRREAAGDGGSVRPVAGSGPLWLVRDQARTGLRAELRISGRAAPGQWLELGGHGYRVGPGGGFAFDLEITDPELIHALLALLPALPVVPRDGD